MPTTPKLNNKQKAAAYDQALTDLATAEKKSQELDSRVKQLERSVSEERVRTDGEKKKYEIQKKALEQKTNLVVEEGRSLKKSADTKARLMAIFMATSSVEKAVRKRQRAAESRLREMNRYGRLVRFWGAGY